MKSISNDFGFNYKDMNLSETKKIGAKNKAESSSNTNVNNGVLSKSDCEAMDKNGDGIITEQEFKAGKSFFLSPSAISSLWNNVTANSTVTKNKNGNKVVEQINDKGETVKTVFDKTTGKPISSSVTKGKEGEEGYSKTTTIYNKITGNPSEVRITKGNTVQYYDGTGKTLKYTDEKSETNGTTTTVRKRADGSIRFNRIESNNQKITQYFKKDGKTVTNTYVTSTDSQTGIKTTNMYKGTGLASEGSSEQYDSKKLISKTQTHSNGKKTVEKYNNGEKVKAYTISTERTGNEKITSKVDEQGNVISQSIQSKGANSTLKTVQENGKQYYEQTYFSQQTGKPSWVEKFPVIEGKTVQECSKTPSTIINYDNNGEIEFTESYKYNKNGKEISRTVTDSKGRLIEEKNSNVNATYEYSGDGKQVKRAYFKNSNDNNIGSETYKYIKSKDASNGKVSETVKYDENGTKTANVSYTYDAISGNKTKEATILFNKNGKQTGTSTIEYKTNSTITTTKDYIEDIYNVTEKFNNGYSTISYLTSDNDIKRYLYIDKDNETVLTDEGIERDSSGNITSIYNLRSVNSGFKINFENGKPVNYTTPDGKTQKIMLQRDYKKGDTIETKNGTVVLNDSIAAAFDEKSGTVNINGKEYPIIISGVYQDLAYIDGKFPILLNN